MKSKGFTLIEMVIVFSIIALIMALAIPGFSDFNRNQILKTAAEELKASFREAQSASLAGKKETCDPNLCDEVGCCNIVCDNSSTLIGYYITLSPNSDTPQTGYSIGLKCGLEIPANYPVKKIIFSNNSLVTLEKVIAHSPTSDVVLNSDVTVMFKPVNKGISFIDGLSTGMIEMSIDSLEVFLTNGNVSYSVTVTSTGDIYETKQL